MASLREVFNQPVLESLIPADPIQNTAFWSSGTFRTDNRITRLMASGSPVFIVPSMNPLDAKVEPNYSNTIYTDIAVPRGVDARQSTGRMAFLNEGFLEARLEKYLQNGVSPLTQIANQITGFWMQEAEYRAIATIVGLRNYDQDNGKVFTIESATAFSAGLLMDAESTMSPKYRRKGAIVMHPAKALQLRKDQLLNPFVDPNDIKPVEVFNGRRVIESDDATKVGTGTDTQYITYLLNEDAFAAQSVAGYDDLELERSASRANGGGTNVLWTRRNMLIHPAGFSFIATDDQLTGGTTNEAISASWADLQNPEYWRLDVDAGHLPYRIIVSK